MRELGSSEPYGATRARVEIHFSRGLAFSLDVSAKQHSAFVLICTIAVSETCSPVRYQFMPCLETQSQTGLFHSASALRQYDKTHAATIACGRVVSTVVTAAAITVSNVATNKDLMAIGPPTRRVTGII
jgi:hypothetical protein